MILLKKHLIITPPKHASVWWRDFCESNPRTGRVTGGQHEAACSMNASYWVGSDREMVGLTRDPFDWYASVYYHALDNGAGQRLIETGNGKDDFKSVLYGMTHPTKRLWPDESSSNPNHLRWTPGIIWPVGHRERWALKRSSVGLWTWMMCVMYGTHDAIQHMSDPTFVPDHFIDYSESPRYAEEWTGVKPDLTPRHTQVRRAELAGKRAPVRDYSALYDAEMSDWITEADGPLMLRFGYLTVDASGTGDASHSGDASCASGGIDAEQPSS